MKIRNRGTRAFAAFIFVFALPLFKINYFGVANKSVHQYAFWVLVFSIQGWLSMIYTYVMIFGGYYTGLMSHGLNFFYIQTIPEYIVVICFWAVLNLVDGLWNLPVYLCIHFIRMWEGRGYFLSKLRDMYFIIFTSLKGGIA